MKPGRRGSCPRKKNQTRNKKNEDMIALVIEPMFAAAGYSLLYLLGGGGIVGAIVIFFVAKMFRK
jgi:hypothetical protein